MVLRAYLIFEHVVDYSIYNHKLDKIELGHRCAQALELDPLRPTKRVEEFLGISIQT